MPKDLGVHLLRDQLLATFKSQKVQLIKRVYFVLQFLLNDKLRVNKTFITMDECICFKDKWQLTATAEETLSV